MFPDEVRIYAFGGTQHGPAADPPGRGIGDNLLNPGDYRPLLRGLLDALDAWVTRRHRPAAERLSAHRPGHAGRLAPEEHRLPGSARRALSRGDPAAAAARFRARIFDRKGIITVEPPTDRWASTPCWCRRADRTATTWERCCRRKSPCPWRPTRAGTCAAATSGPRGCCRA